jgi:sortase A
MRARKLLRCAEYALGIAGALAAGFCAGEYLGTHIYQGWQNQRLEEALRAERTSPHAVRPKGRTPRPVGSLIGRLEIPRLKFSAIVLEGSDSRTLRVGVGRIPQTADPGQEGNMVLGGHRDSFFRPLRGIRDGDTIELTTPTGSYRYVVDWTTVVKPTDISTLQPTPSPVLTLVTCYPFFYIGPAPKRFIVRAHQVAEGPGASVTAENPRPKGTSQVPGTRGRQGSALARNLRDENPSESWR